MSDSDALQYILRQIGGAKVELDAYPPANINWYSRSVATTSTLVPWLIKEAPRLKQYVERVLNSPIELRSAWQAARQLISSAKEVARIDELLKHEQVLLDFVAGDTVSIVVTSHLISSYQSEALVGNSKSDYPDLFLSTSDYSELPRRNRKDKIIGAAVRGVLRRPVRVPDGLEIKTSRNNATIDCHYPHAGLHLMVSFTETNGKSVVDDVLAAYLCRTDYRISGRSTEATTVKASFNRSAFVSLMPR